MKSDYRIDYIGLTAAHFTTFPQTPNSEKIVGNNNHDLVDRARQAQASIGEQARDKAQAALVPKSFSRYV